MEPEVVLAPRRVADWHRMRRQFFRHRLGPFGLGVLFVVVVMAVFAPWVAGQPPETTALQLRNQPPSREHILGTDAVGRDIWARLVYGSRVSIAVGLVSVGLYTAISVVLGSLSGYFGGRVDDVIMRVTDVFLCLPSLLLIITVTSVMPPNIINIMVAIGIFGWPTMCRLVRAQFLMIRQQDFVVAAQCLGVPTPRIIFRHMLPGATGPVLVAATLGIGNAILIEASLSFLGLGVQEPTSSWGVMLLSAMQLPVLAGMPWRWLPPAVAISLTVLAVNFVGDALHDALDPRTNFGR